MKCQHLFTGKKEKKLVPECHLLKILPSIVSINAHELLKGDFTDFLYCFSKPKITEIILIDHKLSSSFSSIDSLLYCIHFCFQFTDVLFLVIIPRLQEAGRIIKDTVKTGQYIVTIFPFYKKATKYLGAPDWIFY